MKNILRLINKQKYIVSLLQFLCIINLTNAQSLTFEKTEEGEMPQVDVEGGNLPEYEINKTEEGEMPDVDVEGGNLPKYDVEGPDVDIGTTTKEVEVPTVDIDMPDDDDDEVVDEEDSNR